MDTVLGVSLIVKIIFLLLSPIEEFNGNLLKQGERKKVLILLTVGSNSLTKRINLGCDFICGPVVNDILVANNSSLKIIGDRRGASAVFTAYQGLEFLRNTGVATLTRKDDVINRLRTNDL